MKFQRQSKILELIGKEDIETQEELAARVRQAGFVATQATISRDVKELRLIKTMAGSGRYKYSVSAHDGGDGFTDRLRTVLKESITDYDRAQNIVVIKTPPGFANAACAAIDAMKIKMLVGSIAGDDTAFLLMKDNTSADDFMSEIKKLLEE